MWRTFLLATITLTFTTLAAAQTGSTLPKPGHGALSSEGVANESSLGSIRGKVVLPDGMQVSEAFRITLSVMRGTHSISYTDQQGQFEFLRLPPGEYSVEVEGGDKHRFEVTRETVQVFRGSPSIVTVTLKEKADSKVVKDAPSVSVTEISQDVPPRALKEFDRGTKAAQEGKKAEAILHLRKATELYPDFLKARNDLGALLLESGDLDRAEQELRRAMEIDPKAFNPIVNLGIVLVKKRATAEAVRTLEQATSLNPTSALARLYLGIALSGVDNLDRAQAELKAAYKIGGHEFALALFHLGQVYLQTGQREAARDSFELYLREIPNAENSEEVRKLIAMLK